MLPKKFLPLIISSLTVFVTVVVAAETKDEATKKLAVKEVQGKNAASANKKSFVFETESDYGEYGVDNYSSGYATNYRDYTDEYNDAYQSTRGGRDYYQPEASETGKIQFPPNDASESLSDIHQSANLQLPLQDNTNKVRGGRGLYPYESFKQGSGSAGLHGSDYSSHVFDGNDFTSEDASAPSGGGDPYSVNNFPSQAESFAHITQQQTIFAAQQQAQHEAAQYEKQQEKQRKEREHLQKIQQQLSFANQAGGYFGQQAGGFEQQTGGFGEQPGLAPPPQAQTLHQSSPFNAGQNIFSSSSPPQGPVNEYSGPFSPEYLESQGIYLVEKYGNPPFNAPPGSWPSKPTTSSPYSPNIFNQYPGVFVSPTAKRPTLPPSGHGFQGDFHLGSNFVDQPQQSNYLGPFAQQRPQRPAILTGENHPSAFGGQSGFGSQPGFSGFGSGGGINGQSPYGQNFAGSGPYTGQFSNGFSQQYGDNYPYRPGQPDPQQVGLLGGIAGAFGFNRRGPNPALQDNFGNRISRAIEGITKNDDLQCVPKVVCQMVGSRMRTRPLPSFIDASSLGGLIQTIPVEAPAAIYVKAALLGVTNGEYRCNNAYPRCPRENDDVLYYLNNHRGGFFRFFSGEDNTLEDQQQYKPQQQQHQQTNGGLLDLLSQFGLDGAGQGGSASNQLNLIALQNIAAALSPSSTNQVSQTAPQQGLGLGSGINLSQIGSGISMLSSLANLFGGQGRSRDSGILSNDTTGDKNVTGRQLLSGEKEVENLKGVDFKEVFNKMAKVFKDEAAKEATLAQINRKEDKSTKVKRSIDDTTTAKQPRGVSNDLEPRIVNQYVTTITEIDNGFKIPSNNRFTHSTSSFNNNAVPNKPVSFFQNQPQQQQQQQPQQRPVRVESLPIKTGTGNLGYDNMAYLIQLYQQQIGPQHEKIQATVQELQQSQLDAQKQEELNRLQQFYTNTYRLQAQTRPQSTYQRPSYSYSQSNYQRPSYSSASSTYSNNNRYTSNGATDHRNRIYVTNSRGQNEYYIDTLTNKKHYL